MRKLFTLLILFTAFTPAIAQNNPLFDYIPEKTSTVIHMDLLRLQAKVPRIVFEQSVIYKELTKEPHSPLPEFLKNPAKTGIDFSAGVMITTNTVRIEMIGLGSSASIFFKLNNPALFKSFVETMHASSKPDAYMSKEKNEIKVYGTDHILFSDGKMALAWNDKVMVMSSGPEEFDFFETTSVPDTVTVLYDSAVVMYDSLVLSPAEEAKRKELDEREKRNHLFELLTPKLSNPLTTDVQFAGLMKEKADIRVWSDQSNRKIPPYFPGGPAQILTKIQQLGTKKSTAVINFENGKISMLAKNYPSPKIADLYKDFKISTQNGELLRKLPPDNVIGLMSVSLDKLMLNRIIEMMELESMIQKMQKEIPVKIDLPTLTAAFKTNMLMALLKTDEVGEEAEMKRMDGFSFLMAIPIADKNKFDQLRATLQPYLDSMKTANPEKIKKSPVIKFSDEMLVLALSSKTADAFLFNPAPGESPAWLHEFSQYPIVMNFNFKKLFSFLMKKDSENGKEEMEAVSKTFDQIFFYGGNYNKDAVEMNMEFRFVNKEENALKQFFQMLGSLK